MCWRSSKAVKQIAKKDIKTFKVGIKRYDGNFSSYYCNYAYALLQKYETEIHLIYYTDRVEIDEGFHSYNSKCCKVSLNVHLSRYESFYINKKDIRYLDYYSLNCNLLIAECIIPKGAEYYENEVGEIVSNQIIIKRIKSIE